MRDSSVLSSVRRQIEHGDRLILAAPRRAMMPLIANSRIIVNFNSTTPIVCFYKSVKTVS
jgi:hypothetical protein